MVDRDAFGDRVQQRRLAGACRRDDERALAVADRRDEVDRAARELVAALGGRPVSSVELSLGIRRGERLEVRPLERRAPGSRAVDRLDFDRPQTRPRWSRAHQRVHVIALSMPHCRTICGETYASPASAR